VEEIGGISFRVEADTSGGITNLQALKSAASAARQGLEALGDVKLDTGQVQRYTNDLVNLRRGVANTRQNKSTENVGEFNKALITARRSVEEYAAVLSKLGVNTDTTQRVRQLNAEAQATRELTTETNTLAKTLEAANKRSDQIIATRQQRMIDKARVEQKAAQTRGAGYQVPSFPNTSSGIESATTIQRQLKAQPRCLSCHVRM
jgi:hypothetical protein